MCMHVIISIRGRMIFFESYLPPFLLDPLFADGFNYLHSTLITQMKKFKIFPIAIPIPPLRYFACQVDYVIFSVTWLYFKINIEKLRQCAF